jgi:hypothetical protein
VLYFINASCESGDRTKAYLALYKLIAEQAKERLKESGENFGRGQEKLVKKSSTKTSVLTKTLIRCLF